MTLSVVVTGVGAVTPLGPSASTTWEALKAGRSSVRPITRFDTSGFATTFASEIDRIPELSGDWAELRHRLAEADLLDRKIELLLVAASEAWTMAGGEGTGIGALSCAPERVATSIGSEAGRKLLEDVAARSVPYLGNPDLGLVIPSLPQGEWARMRPSHPAAVLSAALGARGPSRTISTACTSSGGAIAEGLFLIRSGQADVAVCGGTDTLVEVFMLSGFNMLGALSTRNDAPATASRPFDATRDGFVLAEGAGVLILESEEHALARGARPLGRLLGAGLSNNAYRVTDSPPGGDGPALSMRNAMTDAGVRPEQVPYINAHGTSTVMNDLSETRGIHAALGQHAHKVAVSSNKSMFGHLVAACGAVEAISTLYSLRDGVLAPTVNLQTPDPECDLDYVPGIAREVPGGFDVALSNAFGFGGSNATLCLGAW